MGNSPAIEGHRVLYETWAAWVSSSTAGPIKAQWLDWPGPSAMVECRPLAARAGFGAPLRSALLKRRLRRRRNQLNRLGLFPVPLPGDQSWVPPIGAFGPEQLSLPVWVSGEFASNNDDMPPGFLRIPEGYIAWLFPEEITWLRSQIMGGTGAAILRNTAAEARNLRVVRAQRNVAGIVAMAAVVSLLLSVV